MWAKKTRFLKENKGWKEPQILGGVTSQGKAKPDFMMYYDAGETTAPINCWAKKIASLRRMVFQKLQRLLKTGIHSVLTVKVISKLEQVRF